MSRKITTGLILSSVMLTTLAFKTQTAKPGKFQNGGNNNYRIYEKESYLILDTASFYLYYRYASEEKVKGKGLVKVEKYFFSKDAGSPILILTTDNLEKTFPDNLAFHYAIEAFFRTNQDLISYDSYCSCYKLKYIYKQSLKQ
jgi:hypothetical protein